MAKFEHMSDERVLAHASMIGHIARATVLEGKDYTTALDEARSSVGDASRNFVRQPVSDPYGTIERQLTVDRYFSTRRFAPSSPPRGAS